MANERKVSGPTLIELVLSESLGGPRRRAFLAKMQQAVPWEVLAKPVRELYHNDAGKGGRPNVSAVVIVRAHVEHVFGWGWQMGQFVRARYRGIRRNAEDIGWGLMAYNFKRSVSLMPV